jgi:hypothetical protein
VPNLTSAGNFSSGGGGSSSSSAATTTRSNPYAAVQAHARKLNRGGRDIGAVVCPVGLSPAAVVVIVV